MHRHQLSLCFFVVVVSTVHSYVHPVRSVLSLRTHIGTHMDSTTTNTPFNLLLFLLLLLLVVSERLYSLCSLSRKASRVCSRHLFARVGSLAVAVVVHRYKGQILTSTFPLIGNFGVPDHKAIDEYGLIKNLESDKIHVSGLVVQECVALNLPSTFANNSIFSVFKRTNTRTCSCTCARVSRCSPGFVQCVPSTHSHAFRSTLLPLHRFLGRYSEHYSHFEAVQSLSDWMAEQGIPGITGVDTRAVTKAIRQVCCCPSYR